MNNNRPESLQNSRQQSSKLSGTVHTVSSISSSHSPDPFHHNYTLTGLINHIEKTITELIQTKKIKETHLQHCQNLQLKKLIKIHEQVEVLKNIIVYNLTEIFNVMYPSSCQNKESPRTNITVNKKKEDQKDQSITLSDFDDENEGLKMGKINHLEVNRQSLHYYNSQCQKETCGSETVEDGSQIQTKESELKRETHIITPFHLPQQCIKRSKPSNGETIKVEDGQGDEEDGIDLLCYEDEKSIEGYRGIKWREVSEKGFSPIEEREPWEEETEEKRFHTFTLNQFHQQTNPYHLSRMSSKEIVKRLFSYTGVVLPKRLRKKKFNYLEQISNKK